jgi:signal-transduction protein with cAMP-binding, CBS, and nucleotidyltransferase domain
VIDATAGSDVEGSDLAASVTPDPAICVRTGRQSQPLHHVCVEEVMVGLTKKDRVALLRSVWLFERCTSREIALLDRATSEAEVPAGRVLATQGELGREFVVIVDGKAEVTRDGIQIATLGAGSFFGEMSLLDQQPRTATVTTVEPTRLLVMTPTEFNSVVSTMPSVDRKMLVVLVERLREIEAKYVPDAERVSPTELT